VSEDKPQGSKGGLEGVTVAQSGIATIDGTKGELRYRGYSIEELARESSFAEVACLLWNGELPTKDQLTECERGLAAHRSLMPEAKFLAQGLATRAGPMDALRTMTSALSTGDSEEATNAARALRLTAGLPTIVAAYARARANEPVLDPREDLGHAANLLYMLRGSEPTTEEARVLDVCLILHAEHGFNASTFSGRVTASTLSDIYSAVTAAIATLKGPLHGGANTAVMNMLLEIDDESNIAPYLEDKLANKQRIMGFGHRVYKVIDPRATVLKALCERVAKLNGDPKWFHLSVKVEEEMNRRKGLYPNVDFYSAATYHYLGIPADLFTPIFAISRIVGWTAHILEQYENNRLIRPRSEYVGPGPRPYVPIQER